MGCGLGDCMIISGDYVFINFQIQEHHGPLSLEARTSVSDSFMGNVFGMVEETTACGLFMSLHFKRIIKIE